MALTFRTLLLVVGLGPGTLVPTQVRPQVHRVPQNLVAGPAKVVGLPLADGNDRRETATYRTVTRKEKHEFAQQILDRMSDFVNAYRRRWEKEPIDYEPTLFDDTLGSVIEQTTTFAEKVRNCKITYRHFCSWLEALFEELECFLEDAATEDENPAVVALAQEVTTFLRQRVEFVKTRNSS